ncbi:MAG: flagellar basal-body rod protein FlgG [Armatimonadetes bacterium]|nr:flagellar basal-body rod protein FlgG [Armatimonadota bacterium]
MIRALNTAATGMVAQQRNLDTIANNLANVNTTAFKQQRAEFQDLVYQTFRASGASTSASTAVPQAAQIGLGARFSASATSFAIGSIESSANPLHFAITGSGFFQVTLPDGTTAYTRDGSFNMDANGQIVTSDGYLVEPNIVIPSGAQALTVSPSGIFTAVLPDQNDPTELGALQIAIFPNPGGLTRLGQNLYRGGGASGDPTLVTPGEQGSGAVGQYLLEGSNVQVVEEMVRMIIAQRAYEINSKAIQTADDMLSTLNNLKR